MAYRPSPTVRARRLRYELQRLRKRSGLTIEQVAERARDYSTSAISRWENGERRIRPADLGVLLDVYEVSDAEREVLLTLAREARLRGWWQQYGGAIPPWFQVFVGLESGAESVHTYGAELIPGLLQTPDYHRAFLEAAPAAGDQDMIEQQIAVRTARQERLTGDNPLTFWAVINEAVIRRVVGGPDVMRAQLHHVADMATRPHVNVQVLTFRSGAHPAMDGGFTILSFPETDDPDVGYIESQAGSLYLEERQPVERYTLMHRFLVAKALDPDESRDLITAVANEL